MEKIKFKNMILDNIEQDIENYTEDGYIEDEPYYGSREFMDHVNMMEEIQGDNIEWQCVFI